MRIRPTVPDRAPPISDGSGRSIAMLDLWRCRVDARLLRWTEPPASRSPLLAVPAYKSIGTVASGAAGSGASPAWGTHASGDRGVLVVVQGRVDGSTDPGVATLTTANGFAAISGADKASTYDDGFLTHYAMHITCFEAEATSGSMSAPTVAAIASNAILAFIIVFDGTATGGSAVDVVSTPSANNNTGTAVTIAGTTTTVANTIVLAVVGSTVTGGSPNLASWSNTDLSSVTERADTAANGIIIGCATGDKAAAGAYGNTTVTSNGSGTWAGLTIAIKGPPPFGGASLEGRMRPRIVEVPRRDIRQLMRTRAQASDRPRDLRLLTRAHAPDGYGLGEIRSGVGQGYLTDVETRGAFTPNTERIADTGRMRPRFDVPEVRRRAPQYGSQQLIAINTGEIAVAQSPDPADAIGGTVSGSAAITLVGTHTNITVTLLWQPNPYAGGMSDVFLDGFSSSGWIPIGGDVWAAQYSAALKAAGTYTILFSYGPLNLNPSRQVQLSVASAYSDQVPAFTQNPGTSTIEVDL